ncbi:MAG: hypothetical protein Kow00124_26470 [Anaerolineae bacterium]
MQSDWPAGKGQTVADAPGRPGRRIVVIGTSGSGKTTMARHIAARLGLLHVELDALHWEPGWVETPPEVMRERVRAASAGDAWVFDGNYSVVRDILWARADTVVWLDFPLHVILWRLWWRTLDRALMRRELWNGNRERLYTHFFTRDSLFLWVLQSYPRRRREYPMLLSRPEYAHLTTIRLRSPREARRWLEGLG